jgi:hypothetical protein
MEAVITGLQERSRARPTVELLRYLLNRGFNTNAIPQPRLDPSNPLDTSARERFIIRFVDEGPYDIQ